jgi:hypothetical protein
MGAVAAASCKVKYTGQSRLSPHPSNADDDNAADDDTDNVVVDGNTDNNADINSDNDEAMQRTDNDTEVMRCR